MLELILTLPELAPAAVVAAPPAAVVAAPAAVVAAPAAVVAAPAAVVAALAAVVAALAAVVAAAVVLAALVGAVVASPQAESSKLLIVAINARRVTRRSKLNSFLDLPIHFSPLYFVV
jgi:hypothetical protein